MPFWLRIFALCTMPLWAFSQNPAGKITSLDGQVLIHRHDGRNVDGQINTPIFRGDEIESGYRTAVQIFLQDGTQLTLGGSSLVKLTTYSFGEGSDAMNLDVKDGALRISSGLIAKRNPARFRIKTKNTDLRLDPKESRGAVIVAEIVSVSGSLPRTFPQTSVRLLSGDGLWLVPKENAAAPLNLEEAKTYTIHAQEIDVSKALPFEHWESSVEATVAQGRYDSAEERRSEVQAYESIEEMPKDSREKMLEILIEDWRYGYAKDPLLRRARFFARAQRESAPPLPPGYNPYPGRKKGWVLSGDKESSGLLYEGSTDSWSFLWDTEKNTALDPFEIIQREQPTIDWEKATSSPSLAVSMESGWKLEASRTVPFQEAPFKVDSKPSTSFGLALSPYQRQAVDQQNTRAQPSLQGPSGLHFGPDRGPIAFRSAQSLLGEFFGAEGDQGDWSGARVSATLTNGVYTISKDTLSKFAIKGSGASATMTLDRDSGGFLTFSFTASSGLAFAGPAYARGTSVGTTQLDVVYDNMNQYFSFSEYSNSTIGVSTLGAPPNVQSLSGLGIRKYVSDPDGVDVVTTLLTLVAPAGQKYILDAAHNAITFVDFNTKNMAGKTVVKAADNDFLSKLYPTNYALDQRGWVFSFPSRVPSPLTITPYMPVGFSPGLTHYVGQLTDAGTFENIKLYRNLGFIPRAAFLDSTSSFTGTLASARSLAGDVALRSETLEAFNGSGSLHGSENQGLSLLAIDATQGHMIVGGLKNDAFISRTQASLTTQDGLYQGFGRGLRVNGSTFYPTSITSLFIGLEKGHIDLGLNTNESGFSGHFSSDSVLQFAGTRESLFSAIKSSDVALSSSKSFMAALELPQFGSTATAPNTSQTYSFPADVIWGTWNIQTQSAGIVPGLHSFWVAALPTTLANSSASTYKAKLNNVVNTYATYRGAALTTFSDSAATSTYETADSPLGYASYSADLVAGTFEGLIFYPGDRFKVVALKGNLNGGINGDSIGASGNVVALKSGISNATASSTYSLGYTGGQAFNDGLGSFRAQFATSSAASLISDFSRSYGNEAIQGVSIAQRSGSVAATGAGANAVSETYNGFTEAVFINSSGLPSLVNIHVNTTSVGTDNVANYNVSFSAAGDGATSQFATGRAARSIANGMTLYTEGVAGGQTILRANGAKVSTFISKDAFFADLSSVGATADFGTVALAKTIDTSSSFIAGLPGLDDYRYVSWGIWSAKDSASSASVLGYFAVGVADNPTLAIPNFSHPSITTNLTYSGRAIGHVFTTATGAAEFRTGSASMSIDPSAGRILNGQINLGSDVSITFSSAALPLSKTSGNFVADTAWGTGTVTDGARISLVQNEAAGVFRAQDAPTPTRVAVGAFGMKETSLGSSLPTIAPTRN